MKSNTEWKAWGKEDPLYAVATWAERDKAGANPWRDEEFYEIGRSDWADFRKQWAPYGLGDGHCLEIGCGAGRITKQLAGQFRSVTAIDVSPDQISYAASRVPNSNVGFRVTEGIEIPLESASVDAVFSCHVFQHFDSLDDARRVFAEIYRVMTPGATFCIHLPISTLPGDRAVPLVRLLLSLSGALSAAKANLDRKRGKMIMRGLWYERAWLSENLADLGFRDLEIHGFQMNSNHAWHDLLLAGKSA